MSSFFRIFFVEKFQELIFCKVFLYKMEIIDIFGANSPLKSPKAGGIAKSPFAIPPIKNFIAVSD